MKLISKESVGELKRVPSAQITASAESKLRNAHASTSDKPFIIIEPKKLWAGLNPRDLWNYKELLYFLIWRDIKVRYKQTLLGVVWVILQPLATMLIFTLLFGRLAGLDERTGGIPYPIFAFAGLLPWTFFSGAVITSSNSLVSNAHLLTKVYFPRIIVPVSAVGGLLLDFILGAVFLVGLMFYYDVAPTLKFLMFPALAALTILLAVGVGTLLSALNVKYRDIRHALPFLMQMWMFASPVIYPTSLVPENWRWVLSLNPMTGIVEGFRAALFAGQNFNWRMLSASAAITLVITSVAILIFRRAEKEFADIV